MPPFSKGYLAFLHYHHAMTENQNTKTALRHSMRLARALLSSNEQTEKVQQLTRIVLQLPIFIESQHIAAYWPNDSEISSLDILITADKMGKSCYLPKLNPSPIVQMAFIEYYPKDELMTNHLGILEPVPNARKSISPESLDLVLVPLVAFDKQGQRLGMGKGYYDHTFAFRQNHPQTKPFLLGIAYDLQEMPKLPSNTWDVFLDGIATETQYIDLRNS